MKRRRARHPLDGEGFRETFLVHFTRRGDRPALRRLTSLMIELYIGARPRWWPDHREGDLYALLGAAILDLRHLRDVLLWADAGEDRSMEAAALAGYARKCGEEVEKIADGIEEAMADPQGTLERERALLDYLTRSGSGEE